MNDFLRIPFGQRESDGEQVDVHEVPNGRACGCICPSCNTPLVAKQGSDREWHFAHASKSVYEKTSNQCEYSIYVSSALMAKQLFMSCNSVSLPEYVVTLNGLGEITSERHSIQVQVTKSSIVDIDSCKVETDINGFKTDVLTTVNGMPLLFYLVHPERTLSLDLDCFKGQSIGVISIDLAFIPQLLRQASGSKGGYKAELAKFLFNGFSGKKWMYHPRQERKLSQGNEKLKILCEEKSVKTPVSKAFYPSYKLSKPEEFNEPEIFQVRYQCVYCNGLEWIGPNLGGNKCPLCNQHLYTKNLGRVK